MHDCNDKFVMPLDLPKQSPLSETMEPNAKIARWEWICERASNFALAHYIWDTKDQKGYQGMTYQCCKAIEAVTAFLDPKEDIVERSLAMFHQEVIILKKLGSNEVSYGGDDDNGVGWLGIRQGIAKQNRVGGFGHGDGLDGRVWLWLLELREESNYVRISENMTLNRFGHGEVTGKEWTELDQKKT
jgi:hypothetical protein